MSKCVACSHNYCRPAWVYVIEDVAGNRAKIGQSMNPGHRLARLRQQHGEHINLIYKVQASCRFLITSIEKAAHARTAAWPRLSADWFSAPASVAVKAVEDAVANG